MSAPVTGRAFVSESGRGGSTFRLIRCAGTVPPADERQVLASGVAEQATIFLATDGRSAALHNRTSPRPLIAHALLGTVAALAAGGGEPERLILESGPVTVWREADGRCWLRAPASWSPNDRTRQVGTVREVEELASAPPDEPVLVWAWIDEPAGRVRARYFAPSAGKPEDEACGSACMVLADELGRALSVDHGRHCSSITVRPAADGVECGGWCVLDAPG